jgi:hypothetical protein
MNKERELERLNSQLEVKLNEHKMLMETFHEAFRKGSSSNNTLREIQDAMDETLNDITSIKEEIDKLNNIYWHYDDSNASEKKKTKTNIFDSIKKEYKEDVVPANCETKYDRKHTYFDEIWENDGTESSKIVEMNTTYKDDVPEKIHYNNIGELLNVDNILFCNRFLFDLSPIGIPETMVKWVHSDVFNGDNIIEAQIYDFVNEDGEPVLSILSKYIGTKFTAEIKHLNPIGTVIYKEKYNGCKIEKIIRDSLRYDESEPSGILLRIHYDGVSYEAGC